MTLVKRNFKSIAVFWAKLYALLNRNENKIFITIWQALPAVCYDLIQAYGDKRLNPLSAKWLQNTYLYQGLLQY